MAKKLLISAIAAAGLLAACTDTNKISADKREAKKTNDIQEAYITNQPIPSASWSQQRQTLIDVERMQIETTATFTFFFAVGRADAAPVFSCPSIGDPLPATYQLTNPVKPYGDVWDNGGGVTIAQMEATGVFTGDTDGTHVLCLKDNGTPYKVYWEGQVFSTTLDMEWDGTKLVPKNGAESTFAFKTGS